MAALPTARHHSSTSAPTPASRHLTSSLRRASLPAADPLAPANQKSRPSRAGSSTFPRRLGDAERRHGLMMFQNTLSAMARAPLLSAEVPGVNAPLSPAVL